MARTRIAIIGAGGFAREVAWLVNDINRDRNQFEFLGFIVSDLTKVSEHDDRHRLLGDFSWLEENFKRIDALAMGLGSPIDEADHRRRIAASLS